MTRFASVLEFPDYWVIPVQGRKITQCVVDYSFSLESYDPDDDRFGIRIATTFELEVNGDVMILSPDRPTELGPALGLLHGTFHSGFAWKNGQLELILDCARVTVAADPRYEAWEVVGPRGIRVISTPGGELSIWT
jgi:hypothetical protein